MFWLLLKIKLGQNLWGFVFDPRHKIVLSNSIENRSIVSGNREFHKKSHCFNDFFSTYLIVVEPFNMLRFSDLKKTDQNLKKKIVQEWMNLDKDFWGIFLGLNLSLIKIFRLFLSFVLYGWVSGKSDYRLSWLQRWLLQYKC